MTSNYEGAKLVLQNEVKVQNTIVMTYEQREFRGLLVANNFLEE